MKNLRDQNGCWNCGNSYYLCKQDDYPQWYCDEKHDRPLADGEWPTFKGLDMDKAMKLMDDWRDWSESKEVKPWQICDCHKRK